MKQSGFNTTLKFENKKQEREPRDNVKPKRKKITWYNPPYSSKVRTNAVKCFMALIDKHFPKSDKLHKIINKNTVKISYSCMPNFKQAILSHNKKILQDHRKDQLPVPKGCNCRKKDECPLKGECLTQAIIYKATVTQTDSNIQDTYIGLTENSFKTRFNLHKSSFKL